MGFFGCVKNIDDCVQDVVNRSRKAQIDSTTHRSILTKTYPLLAKFPFQVQKLMATEEAEVSTQLSQQKPTPNLDIVDSIYVCSCLFFIRYCIPCRHVFHMDRSYSVLTEEIWTQYIENFGNGGLEVYETRKSRQQIACSVAQGQDCVDPGRIERVLKMREVNERIRAGFYNFEESPTHNASEFLEQIETHQQHTRKRSCG